MITKKQCLMVTLGKSAYLRVFGRANKTLTDTTTKEEKEVTRILNGHIVGKKLEPGVGTPTVEQKICTHPATQVKMASNIRPNGKGANG